MSDLEYQAAEMAVMLSRAARWFREYECLHRAKHTPDGTVKADTNARRAREIEMVIERYQRSLEPFLPLPPVSDGITVGIWAEGMIGG